MIKKLFVPRGYLEVLHQRSEIILSDQSEGFEDMMEAHKESGGL
jgi:hypothetical protein